jgi:hypothetical protein
MRREDQNLAYLTSPLPETIGATLYLGGLFGWRRVAVHLVETKFVKYAQYDRAIAVRMREPRQKNDRHPVLTEGRLVILTGQGHPEAPSGYTESGGRRYAALDRESKFPMADPRYDEEFDDWLSAYLMDDALASSVIGSTVKQAVVLRDYRSIDCGNRFATTTGEVQ